MAVYTQAPESIFVYVIVAARRARQLQDGARPLLDAKSSKPTRIAQEELTRGVLEYQVPDLPGGEEVDRDGKRRK
jgi:DNA-directed RNA polymerase subunit omega